MSDPVTITTSGPAPDSLVTEQEYLEREAARLPVSESPFVSVDNEPQFDKALLTGRSIHIRGEGSHGVVSLTTPKFITQSNSVIIGPGCLKFTLNQSVSLNPCAITPNADNITLTNFELTSSTPIASNNCFGIHFLGGTFGHRLSLVDMHIHNWCRCISKEDPTSSTTIGLFINRLYAHTFRDVGLHLNYGFSNIVMRDSRVIGRLPGETHTTHNALYGGANWWDNVFENCLFSEVDRIGFEAMCAGYQYVHHRTRVSNCRAENTGSMGFSTMFGLGVIMEKCIVKNVRWIGFEMGGRPPEFDPTPGNYRYGQGILESCEIDGVTPASDHGYGQAIGISIDGATDTLVRGATRVSNVATSPDGAAGIIISNSERCSVQGATLTNAGNSYIYVARGVTPNTRGFHEISGNTFYNLANSGSHPAVDVFDTIAEVRNNVAWQKPGTTLNYYCNAVLPAKVTVDGVIVPPGKQTFLGSNIIIPC